MILSFIVGCVCGVAISYITQRFCTESINGVSDSPLLSESPETIELTQSQVFENRHHDYYPL